MWFSFCLKKYFCLHRILSADRWCVARSARMSLEEGCCSGDQWGRQGVEHLKIRTFWTSRSHEKTGSSFFVNRRNYSFLEKEKKSFFILLTRILFTSASSCCCCCCCRCRRCLCCCACDETDFKTETRFELEGPTAKYCSRSKETQEKERDRERDWEREREWERDRKRKRELLEREWEVNRYFWQRCTFSHTVMERKKNVHKEGQWKLPKPIEVKNNQQIWNSKGEENANVIRSE